MRRLSIVLILWLILGFMYAQRLEYRITSMG